MERNKKKFELGVSVFLLGMVTYLYYVATVTGKARSTDIASMDFPKAIFVVMMLFCAFLIVQGIIWFIKHPKDASTAEPLMHKKALLTFIFICVYAAFWQIIGFSLSTFIFVSVESYMLDTKKPLKRAIIIGFCVMVFMYLVFGMLFNVNFPEPIIKMIRGY